MKIEWLGIIKTSIDTNQIVMDFLKKMVVNR